MTSTKGIHREGFAITAGLLLLAVAWAGSAVSLRSIDRGKPAGWDQASLLYLPSGKLLKPMALDLDEGLAAVLWVKGILYFSDAFLAQQGYEWLAHILEIVTSLNPRFLPAYEFAGNVLGKKREEWPKIERILERGIATFPTNWRLHVCLAMGRVKVDSNYAAAAKTLESISLLPGVPNHIRTLSATFLEIGGEERLAIAFLVNRYLSVHDALTRDVFVERLLKLSPGVKGRKKNTVYKILDLARVDARSESLVVTILGEYLGGKLGEGSSRVVESLER